MVQGTDAGSGLYESPNGGSSWFRSQSLPVNTWGALGGSSDLLQMYSGTFGVGTGQIWAKPGPPAPTRAPTRAPTTAPFINGTLSINSTFLYNLSPNLTSYVLNQPVLKQAALALLYSTNLPTFIVLAQDPLALQAFFASLPAGTGRRRRLVPIGPPVLQIDVTGNLLVLDSAIQQSGLPASAYVQSVFDQVAAGLQTYVDNGQLSEAYVASYAQVDPTNPLLENATINAAAYVPPTTYDFIPTPPTPPTPSPTSIPTTKPLTPRECLQACRQAARDAYDAAVQVQCQGIRPRRSCAWPLRAQLLHARVITCLTETCFY